MFEVADTRAISLFLGVQAAQCAALIAPYSLNINWYVYSVDHGAYFFDQAKFRIDLKDASENGIPIQARYSIYQEKL